VSEDFVDAWRGEDAESSELMIQKKTEDTVYENEANLALPDILTLPIALSTQPIDEPRTHQKTQKTGEILTVNVSSQSATQQTPAVQPNVPVPFFQMLPGVQQGKLSSDPSSQLNSLTDTETVLTPAQQTVSSRIISASPAPVHLQGPQIASQVTAAIVQTTGATTEITLNPEELGRVRIAMTASDAGMTVTLLAERPETIDLLRRHIDQLARELRDLGYENPTFEFGEHSGGFDNERDQSAHQNGQPDLNNQADNPSQQSIRVALSGGLDLKL